MQQTPIIETKHSIDGRAQSFSCTALSLTPRLAVVRFEHTRVGHAGGFAIPAGSYTLGFFWPRRSYNCYRFTAPAGEVIAHRFDVVEHVRIEPNHVSYRDLLLDLWVAPSGEAVFEDEDDVTAAITDGLLSPTQIDRIDRTRRLLLRSWRRIVAECEQVVERLPPH